MATQADNPVELSLRLLKYGMVIHKTKEKPQVTGITNM